MSTIEITYEPITSTIYYIDANFNMVKYDEIRMKSLLRTIIGLTKVENPILDSNTIGDTIEIYDILIERLYINEESFKLQINQTVANELLKSFNKFLIGVISNRML